MDSAAIFGFAGVLVGAGSTYVMQRGAEGRQDKANARVAVRLLLLDSASITATLSTSLTNGKWWTGGDGFDLVAPNWESNQAALAKALLLSDWLNLRHAFALAESLEGQAKFRTERGESLVLTEKDRETVKEQEARMREATNLLMRLVVDMQSGPERFRAKLKGKARKKP